MKKHWIGNLLLLLTVNLLIKPLWIFGIDRHVQNIAGTEPYGIYFATFNFTVLLYILLDMGMASYNARSIAQNPALLRTYWNSMLFLKAILAILYCAICAFGAWFLAYNHFQMQLLVYLAANQILIAYISYFRANLQGLHHFKTDTLLSVLDRLLAIAFCGVLIYGIWTKKAAINILQYAQIQTLSYFLTAIVGFYCIYRLIRQKPEQAPLSNTDSPQARRAMIDFALLRHIISNTLPFALMVLLMSIYTRIDAVLLAKLLPDGANEAGIYASAYRLLDALNMIGALAATQLLPHFTRLYVLPIQIKPILRLSAAVALLGSLVVSISCWLFRQSIMNALYSHATPYYADVFGYLMWSFIPISLTYVFGTLLTAKGNTRLINIVVGIGMLLNVSLNMALIPIYKALGAAFAALGSQSIIALAFIMAAYTDRQDNN